MGIQIELPPQVAGVLKNLEDRGFEAWLVGGCVRDSLLGLSPSDWDVTTAAQPEKIKLCFAGYPVLETGVRHGTVTVLMDGGPVEITTFRSDGEYADHRRPERVRFSRRLGDDLARRDFTVNAIAYHPDRGFRDDFGGAGDLERRVLRCVGDPARRFTEDALRILRCLRFASVLGFSIEDGTAEALFKTEDLLLEISHERVREELSKLLCGQSAGNVLRIYNRAVFTVLPELAPMEGCLQENPYHCWDVWEHTLHALEASPQDKFLRWAAFLHDCGKPVVKSYGADGTAHFYGHEKASAETAEAIMARLRFSNRDRDGILELIRLHGEPYPISEKRLKRLLRKLGEEQLSRLFRLSEADLSGQSPHLYGQRIKAIRQTEARAKELAAQGQCLSLRDLAVNGNDLRALGYPAGPSLGAALKNLLESVLDGKIQNEKTALLERAAELLETDGHITSPGRMERF